MEILRQNDDDIRFFAFGDNGAFRAITVDGEQLEFSDGFTDLHTRVYQEVLAGRGFGISEARPSIELSHRIRQAPIAGAASAEALRARCLPKANA